MANLPKADELIGSTVTQQQFKTKLKQLVENIDRSYSTLAEANLDIANIGVGAKVDTDDSGLHYKATAGATSLTKSPYDPLAQSKSYTDESLKVVASDSSLVHKNLAKNADFSEGYNGIITLPSSGSGGFNATYPQIPNYYVIKSGANGFATQVSLIDDYWKIGSKKSVEISINKVGATAQDLQLYNIVDIPAELIGQTDIDLTVCIPYINNNSDIKILGLVQKSADKNSIGAYTPVAVNQKYPSKVGVADTLVFTAKITDTSAKYIAVAIRALANSADVTSSVKVGAFSVYFDRPNVEKYEPSVYAQETALIDLTNSILVGYVPPQPHEGDLYTNSLGDLEKALPNNKLINMGDSQFNSLYTKLSAAFTDRAVINGGVGGERTDQILSRLDGVANHTNTSGWVSGQTVKLKAGLVPVSRESETTYRAQWADWLKFRAVPQKISFMRNGVRIATAYNSDRRKVTATVSGTTFTAAGHSFELWDRITPNSTSLPTGMVKDKVYWVRDVTADTFTLAENFQGGNAVTWTAFAGSIDFLSEYEVSWVYDGAGTTITSTINSSWDYSTMLIGGGTNDIVLSKTFAEITTNIRACMNHGKTLHKRVIVSGIPGFYESTDDNGWKIGGAKYNLMMKVNSWIKQEYPLNYVDPYAMLLANGDGSANDNADIAVGLVPRSLRVSATDGHINEAGNTLRVNQIKDLMTALKW